VPLRIEKVFAHVVQQKCGMTYTDNIPRQTMRAVIWEIVAGRHTGFGECRFPLENSPAMPPLTSEACARFKQRVADRGVLSRLLGGSAEALEALLPDLPETCDRELVDIREGLSIALYDLVGKACSLPAHALLGGKRRDRVPGMPVIHTATPAIMAQRAGAWAAAGYRYLKIKPPYDQGECVEALRAIRATVGPDISLQVDGNQFYKQLEQAERMIRAMQPFRIDIFEDMVAGSLDDMAEVKRRTRTVFMVDLEASWPQVFAVCKAGAADVINHHPNNQGGLATAMMIDAVAVSAGLRTAIGSSGRFGVQDAAFQMLGSVIGLSRPCEDIGLTPYYSGPTKGQYAFEREPSVLKDSYPIVEGVIHVPDRPGLGIEVDRERLKAFTVDTIAWE